MPSSNRPRRLARSIVAATLATVAIGAAAHDNERGRHRLPQLAPAKPGALVGTCEELAARLSGLANTVITGSTTIAAGTLQVAGQPIAEHCRVTGKACTSASARSTARPIRSSSRCGCPRPGTAASSTRATAASTAAWSPPTPPSAAAR